MDNVALYLFNTKNNDDGKLLPIEKYRKTTVCISCDLEFSFDNRYVVYQVYNKNIDGYHTYVFDTVSNKSMQSFRSKQLLYFALHPHKAEIAIAFADRVSIYNLNPFKKIQDLDFSRSIDADRYQKIFYSREGNKIIFDNENDSTFIWNEKNGLFDAAFLRNTKITRPRNTLDNNAQNFIVPLWQKEPTIVFYDTQTNEKKHEIATKTFVDFLSFSPNNKFIAGIIDSQHVVVLQASTGKQVLEISNVKKKEEALLPNILFSDDNRKIVISNYSENQETFTIYEIETGKKLYHNQEDIQLYSMDKNFNLIVCVDKNNPNNFILKDLSVITFNVFAKPRQTIFKPITIAHPVKQQPKVMQPAVLIEQPRLLESGIKKQVVLPSQDLFTQPAIQRKEPPIQKTWWQWLTGQ